MCIVRVPLLTPSLSRLSEEVILKFKEACRGDVKLEAPLLRHLLGDPRMERARKECGINIPTRVCTRTLENVPVVASAVCIILESSPSGRQHNLVAKCAASQMQGISS